MSKTALFVGGSFDMTKRVLDAAIPSVFFMEPVDQVLAHHEELNQTEE